MTEPYTYKKVDDWLGTQSVDVDSALTRFWWSLVYVSDALVEIFNWMQRGLFRGRYSRWLSRGGYRS